MDNGRDAPDTLRRGLLSAMGATVLGAVAASAARGAQPGPPAGAVALFPQVATDIRTEFKQLAPGVYAFLQREAPGQSNFSVSNYGIVEGPHSLLAIDAGGAPQHARNFLAAAKPLGKPFDRVIITHEHPDHSTGLPVFPEGIEVISQEETRAQLARMGTPATPAYWKTNPAWGRPDDVNRVVLPTVTFHDRMSLYYGDLRVEFTWPGRAHTSGDALIHVRDRKVIFLGDIGFFGVTPLNGSGFIQDWIKVCDALLADPDAVIMVPGHGPVGGKQELADMRGYLALLLDAGKRGIAAGISAGRAAAELNLGRYATWTDADRVANNMARLYSELRGTIGTDSDRNATRDAVQEYTQLKSRQP